MNFSFSPVSPWFLLNLLADFILSSLVPVPPELIYFTQNLICPALMPALHLTFFVTTPWKQTKFVKLARFREGSLVEDCTLKTCIFLFFREIVGDVQMVIVGGYS